MIKLNHEMIRESREKMRGGNGEVHFIHLFQKEELKGKCRLFSKITIPPGNSIGFHDHADEEEVYFILKGRAEVQDGNEVREVGPGDAVLTGEGAGHSIKNIGTDSLEFLAVILLYA